MRKKLFSILALLLTVSGAWADGTITVYFSNNRNWTNVFVHYWGGSSETTWPGNKMTLVEWNNEGEKVYSAKIPDNTKGIIFNQGDNDAKTGDITTTTSFANGSQWYLTNYNNPYTYAQTTEPHTPITYFIAKYENDAWTILPNSKLQPNYDTQKEYYIDNVELNSGTKIKVVSSEDDGTTIKDKYPADNYNPYQIPINATYSIYCKPYVSSVGDIWYYNILANPTAVTLYDNLDNSATINELNGKRVDVTLTRTLQAGGWNTFCVPFNLDTKPDGWTVRYLSGSSYSNDELTLTFADAYSGGKILAGRPYLVKVSGNVVNPTFYGVTVDNYTTSNTTTYADIVPVMNPTSLKKDDPVLFIKDGNKLTFPSSDGTIKGFRAYFVLKDGTSNARVFNMDFDDDATGISFVLNDDTKSDKGIYMLDGRRVQGQPTQKGVYIVNGKKRIIK